MFIFSLFFHISAFKQAAQQHYQQYPVLFYTPDRSAVAHRLQVYRVNFFFFDKVFLLWMNPELRQVSVTFQHLYGAIRDEVVKVTPPCYTSSSISPFRKFGFSSQNMMITITKSIPRCLTEDYTLGWECNSLPACSWWIGQVMACWAWNVIYFDLNGKKKTDRARSEECGPVWRPSSPK